MLYNYSFANRKRDLSDVMSSVIKDEPRFISNFRSAPDASSAKHEYLEDQLTGSFHAGENIKFHTKGLSKQVRECLSKFTTFRNDTNIIMRKVIAEKQDTKTFRHSAAVFLRKSTADLCFYTTGKGYGHPVSPLSWLPNANFRFDPNPGIFIYFIGYLIKQRFYI